MPDLEISRARDLTELCYAREREVGQPLAQEGEDLPRRVARPEPDLSKKSTPTGGGCHMKQASIFKEMLPKLCRNFTNVHNFPQISDKFD